eukprot:scaffold846_cov252-Pinguiococcus_pyrenoidosus.AAC.47
MSRNTHGGLRRAGFVNRRLVVVVRFHFNPIPFSNLGAIQHVEESASNAQSSHGAAAEAPGEDPDAENRTTTTTTTKVSSRQLTSAKGSAMIGCA